VPITDDLGAPEDLGEELSRHRLRLAPILGVLAATAVSAFCLATLHPVAAGLALIPLGFLVRHVVSRGRDVLTVHRGGFTLRHRGRLHRCHWDDIEGADIRLGDDRRGQLREVTAHGERIVFGRWMGGLDVLYYAYASKGGREPLDVPQSAGGGIGALVSTHRSRGALGWLPGLFIAGFLLLVAVVLFVFTLENSTSNAQDFSYAVVCLAGSAGFLALLLWIAFGDRRDELRIHEHGFAYRHRGTVQECRWDEIADYDQRRAEIWAVMRQDGTWIQLSREIPAVHEYIGQRVRITQDPSPPQRRGRDIEWTEPETE
jgi:hypothetical protein